jgi:hypothetical protein
MPQFAVGDVITVGVTRYEVEAVGDGYLDVRDTDTGRPRRALLNHPMVSLAAPPPPFGGGFEIYWEDDLPEGLRRRQRAAMPPPPPPTRFDREDLFDDD